MTRTHGRTAARRPRGSAGPVFRFILGILLAAYFLALFYWMFIGFGRSERAEGPVLFNLTPFETIEMYLNPDNGLPLRSRLINLAGNVLVFVPFGLILPVISGVCARWLPLTVRAVLGITALETLQLLLRVGSFDVDDIILNLCGVWTGYLLVLMTVPPAKAGRSSGSSGTAKPRTQKQGQSRR